MLIDPGDWTGSAGPAEYNKRSARHKNRQVIEQIMQVLVDQSTQQRFSQGGGIIITGPKSANGNRVAGTLFVDVTTPIRYPMVNTSPGDPPQGNSIPFTIAGIPGAVLRCVRDGAESREPAIDIIHIANSGLQFSEAVQVLRDITILGMNCSGVQVRQHPAPKGGIGNGVVLENVVIRAPVNPGSYGNLDDPSDYNTAYGLKMTNVDGGYFQKVYCARGQAHGVVIDRLHIPSSFSIITRENVGAGIQARDLNGAKGTLYAENNKRHGARFESCNQNTLQFWSEHSFSVSGISLRQGWMRACNANRLEGRYGHARNCAFDIDGMSKHNNTFVDQMWIEPSVGQKGVDLIWGLQQHVDSETAFLTGNNFEAAWPAPNEADRPEVTMLADTTGRRSFELTIKADSYDTAVTRAETFPFQASSLSLDAAEGDTILWKAKIRVDDNGANHAKLAEDAIKANSADGTPQVLAIQVTNHNITDPRQRKQGDESGTALRNIYMWLGGESRWFSGWMTLRTAPSPPAEGIQIGVYPFVGVQDGAGPESDFKVTIEELVMFRIRANFSPG